MNISTDPVCPPRAALRLLNLCAGSAAADAIVGDLLEEYSAASAALDCAAARAWFWRETLRTIPHLLAAGFRSAPWPTAAALIAAYFLRRMTFQVPERLIVFILDRYRVCDAHFNACMFWLSDGVVMGLVFLCALIGALLAIASKGREMTVAAALAAFQLAWTIAGLALAMALLPRFLPNWTVLHELAFSIAIISGGALVRLCRLRRAAHQLAPSPPNAS